MKVTKIELIQEQELLAKLKQTRLRGHGQPYLYKHGSLELQREVDPATLFPAQNYVLESDFLRIEELYSEFLHHAIDIFALEGGVMFWTRASDTSEEDGPIPLIPPVVEESLEPDGRMVPLINDGMHRVYTAKRLGKAINIILARNVPPEYPYYAYACSDGWDGVEELKELPDNYVKKEYRDPNNYKALFRDFNGVFPGVQKQRKKSNPEHLKA